MVIKKQAQKFQQQGLVYFTGTMTEVKNQIQGGKPKKEILPPSGYQNFTPSSWTSKHILSSHNTIVLLMGTKNQNSLLIDWDLKDWNTESQTFEINLDRLEAYNDMVEKLGGEISTYTETTGNGGVHWIYKYDPVKLGYIIKQQEGFVYNGVKCGDIKGENGLCYCAPSSYMGLDGSVKEYVVDNDTDIQMAPDILFELIKFTKYEKSATTKKKPTYAKRENENLPVAPDIAEVEEFQPVAQLNSDYDFVHGYLHCLDPNDYQTWLDVCFSVSSYPQYHTLVHAWAKQSNKYTYTDTQKTIDNGDGRKKIGSLYYMAKKNKAKYIKIFDALFKNDVDFTTMTTTFNDYDICRYFYKFHKYSYVYEERDRTWFTLNCKNIWERSRGAPNSLKKIIIDFITTKLDKYVKILTIKKSTAEEKDKPELVEKIKHINRCILNIGKSVFIKNVIEMLNTYYTDKHISDLLILQDTNRHKFAFENCLFDLDKKDFRPIEPTDYITITAGYDYIDAPSQVEYINTLLESISSNEIEENTGISDLQYLKNILSSTLYGLNKRREFYIFTGTGANGKSLISDALMKPALGEYYKTMSANYYTKSDHSANCATPELADKQYCRALFSSEPEAEEKLQVAKIKSITGLENIPARQLYQTGFEYKPAFTPIILCNDIPEFSKIDKAVNQRVKIVPFKRKFVNNPALPHERQINYNLVKELDTLEVRQAFIWILIYNYKTMDKDHISSSCKRATDEFIDTNNPILEFIESKVHKGVIDSVQCKDMYNAYVQYCAEGNIKPIPNVRFFKLMLFNDFEKSIGTGNKAYYKNCTVEGMLF